MIKAFHSFTDPHKMWWIIGGLVGGLVVVVLTGYCVYKRRNRQGAESM